MEGPSEFYQLLQAYVVLAIGVLVVIVMFDSKTRRDQEHRLALVLGHGGCGKLTDLGYLRSEAGKFVSDSQVAYEQGKQLAEEKVAELTKEGVAANRFYAQQRCDPATDITCGLDDPASYIEGYGVYDNTACHGKAPGTRIQCNLPAGNNLNYYEGYESSSYLGIDNGSIEN